MWLSLVEYLNGVQVVVGSNPAIPTNFKDPAFHKGSRVFLFSSCRHDEIIGLRERIQRWIAKPIRPPAPVLNPT